MRREIWWRMARRVGGLEHDISTWEWNNRCVELRGWVERAALWMDGWGILCGCCVESRVVECWVGLMVEE